MVESSSHVGAPAPQKSEVWTPKRLGLASLGVLLLGTAALSWGVVRSGAGSLAGGRVAPLPAVEAPVVAPLPAAAAPLAPPPAEWITASGSAVRFAATPDRSAVARGGDGLMRVELVMKADEPAAGARTDSDFVVVLDRSGSMAGERLGQAKAAILALVDQLGPADRFGLVTYDDSIDVRIPLGFADPSAKLAFQSAISELQAGGSTNMSGGLDTGLSMLGDGRSSSRPARMILLSDGHANAGDSSPEGLRARGRQAAERELVLSTVGIGAGFNEFLMGQLADAGTGNFHYLTDQQKLGSILERELSSTRTTVARALQVRIAPGSGVTVVDAAGYPLEAAGDATAFKVGSLYAGQERRVWVTLRVPVEREAQYALGRIQLDYVEADQPRKLALTGQLQVKCVTDEKAALASIDKAAWERSVAQDEWGSIQQEVARQVRDGERARAVATLRGYRDKQRAANAVVGSGLVSQNLLEVAALEHQVDDAFAGADQSSKQNAFSKQNLASGRDRRRVGSWSDSGRF